MLKNATNPVNNDISDSIKVLKKEIRNWFTKKQGDKNHRIL